MSILNRTNIYMIALTTIDSFSINKQDKLFTEAPEEGRGEEGGGSGEGESLTI